MYIKTVTIAISSLIVLTSCKDAEKKEVKNEQTETPAPETYQNEGHELVSNLVKKVGNYQTLRSKNDVVYTYTYTTPDGKTDISTEKYIFDGELSYGEYKQHQRTLPQLKGKMEQGYDGEEYWLKIEGALVNDTTALKRVMFSRPTNFYWFTMFQKLLDPELKYEYLDVKEMDDKKFDVVKVSFELNSDKPTDIYQLYINKETGLSRSIFIYRSRCWSYR